VFTDWGWYNELGHDVLRDALVRWYAMSPARQAMVANRDDRFFDVAAVAPNFFDTPIFERSSAMATSEVADSSSASAVISSVLL